MSTDMYKVNQKLKPGKNIIHCRPRVCATCKHFRSTEGFAYCERPEEGTTHIPFVTFDIGDMFQWFTTCDRWGES